LRCPSATPPAPGGPGTARRRERRRRHCQAGCPEYSSLLLGFQFFVLVAAGFLRCSAISSLSRIAISAIHTHRPIDSAPAISSNGTWASASALRRDRPESEAAAKLKPSPIDAGLLSYRLARQGSGDRDTTEDGADPRSADVSTPTGGSHRQSAVNVMGSAISSGIQRESCRPSRKTSGQESRGLRQSVEGFFLNHSDFIRQFRGSQNGSRQGPTD